MSTTYRTSQRSGALSASQLGTLVTVQQRTTVQDALGQPTDTWATSCRLWADVRFQSGLQHLSADIHHSRSRASVRVKQTGCSRTITEGMRLIVDGRTLSVLSVLPQGRDALDLVCESAA